MTGEELKKEWDRVLKTNTHKIPRNKTQPRDQLAQCTVIGRTSNSRTQEIAHMRHVQISCGQSFRSRTLNGVKVCMVYKWVLLMKGNKFSFIRFLKLSYSFKKGHYKTVLKICFLWVTGSFSLHEVWQRTPTLLRLPHFRIRTKSLDPINLERKEFKNLWESKKYMFVRLNWVKIYTR